MTRRVFFSFHYKSDAGRVLQVRNIGKLRANRPALDNHWEEIKEGGSAEIRKWIASQMKQRTCTVVLVGKSTASRKWVRYEIKKSWSEEMGVVGIYIHGLKDLNGETSKKGKNPFDKFKLGKRKMSSIVKCYNPPGRSSRQCYSWIAKNLEDIVEEAIEIRTKYIRS